MGHAVYNESFLPLRFFLHTIAVHCPSCQKRAFITTDIPPVAHQEPIVSIFNDGGTFSYKDYAWTKGRFFCFSCQKNVEIDRKEQLKAWYGPVEGAAESICSYCNQAGYKEKLSYVKKYKSKNHVPEKINLTCKNCLNTSCIFFETYPLQSASIPIDPVCGLPLFAVTTFRNEKLWAYNIEHLKHIKAYIKAKQRKKIFEIDYSCKNTVMDQRKLVMSFSEQLPKVVKSEAHRDAILQRLNLLNQMLI